MSLWGPDTSAEAREVQIERWRQMSPEDKITAVMAMNRLSRHALLAGLRERYPQASENELRGRACALLYGDELARKAYGWEPDERRG